MIIGGQDINFVRKLFQSIGMGGAILFLLLMPLSGSSMVALTLTSCAMGALAFCYSGADPPIMEIAPRYRGFITGLVGTLGNLPGIIAIPR